MVPFSISHSAIKSALSWMFNVAGMWNNTRLCQIPLCCYCLKTLKERQESCLETCFGIRQGKPPPSRFKVPVDMFFQYHCLNKIKVREKKFFFFFFLRKGKSKRIILNPLKFRFLKIKRALMAMVWYNVGKSRVVRSELCAKVNVKNVYLLHYIFLNR